MHGVLVKEAAETPAPILEMARAYGLRRDYGSWCIT